MQGAAFGPPLVVPVCFHPVGFGTPPTLPPDDHELVDAAEKALAALARNVVGRKRADLSPHVAAWVDVALSSTRRLAQVLPPKQQPAVADQIELGDFTPTPPPGGAHALRG